MASKLKQPLLTGFGTPTKRSKFQIGDTVTVYIPNKGDYYKPLEYFRIYQPKYALPYIGKVGIVDGYKSSGQQTRYAVTFDDGLTLSFEAGFLLGPFSSREAAEKYSREDGIFTGELDVKDLKGYVANDVEVNEEFENNLKKSFCNEEMGFTWLDREVMARYLKFNVHVLAYKKNTSNMKTDGSLNKLDFNNHINFSDGKDGNNGSDLKFLDDCFVILKTIDPITNKLIKTSSVVSGGFNNVSSPYYILYPSIREFSTTSSSLFKDGKILDQADMFRFKVASISTKTIERVLRAFKRFKTGYKDGFDLFKEQYGVEEGKPGLISSRSGVFIDENVLGSSMSEIVRYTIKTSDCFITVKNSVRRLSYLPKEIISKSVTLYFDELDDLTGLEKCKFTDLRDMEMFITLNSLRGLPPDINNSAVRLHVKTLDSFIGVPSELDCSVNLDRVNSFKGADGCSANKWISVMDSPEKLDGFFKSAKEFRSYSITEKEIERYKTYRAVEERLPELEGIF